MACVDCGRWTILRLSTTGRRRATCRHERMQTGRRASINSRGAQPWKHLGFAPTARGGRGSDDDEPGNTGGNDMDLRLSEEQQLIRRSTREFAETVVLSHVQQMEDDHATPTGLVQEMAKMGMMGVCVPREFGGTGLGHLARTVMLEEVGRTSAASAFLLQICHLGIDPIVAAGNDAQKKQYLPALARGECLAACAVTETTG